LGDPILNMRLLLLVVLLGGCAARVAPPTAESQPRPFPDLGGQTVMLLPVQPAVPALSLPASADPAVAPELLPADMVRALESELAYWLPQRAPRARWVDAEAIERAVRGSGRIEVRPRELTVRDFQRARLQSIGDPLYGELRRLGALMDARAALLPVGALWVTERTGGGRVHLVLALIDTVGGDVLWYGAIAGTQGERGDAAVVASVAQAVARAIPQ
jgi:hypothetical protein